MQEAKNIMPITKYPIVNSLTVGSILCATNIAIIAMIQSPIIDRK